MGRRHDSVTSIKVDGDTVDDWSSCDEVDKFEDAHEIWFHPMQQVLQNPELLDRILSLDATTSSRATARAVFRAGRVNKTWYAAIKNSSHLQRLVWFIPPRNPPSRSIFDDSDKIFVHFNPILWPVQPEKCTIDVAHCQLQTGSRGVASWRKMLVGRASHSRFAIVVAVDGLRIAVVWCTAATTMGMLLDKARKSAAEGRDLDVGE